MFRDHLEEQNWPCCTKFPKREARFAVKVVEEQSCSVLILAVRGLDLVQPYRSF
jgi:hypothetical protein